MNLWHVSAAALLWSLTSAAQGELAITGATLIDGTGHKPVEQSAVVVADGQIAYAGALAAASIPEGATVIDASGKYLIPGLADMHNHLYDGTFELGRPQSDQARNLHCLMASGITTVFDPSITMEAFHQLKRLSAGQPSRYPNFFSAGMPFAPEGGHGARQANLAAEADSARDRVRKLKEAGVDAIKLYYTDLTYVSKKPHPMLKAEIMRAVIDEAHRQGLKAYVHAPILRYAKEVLEAGADGLVHGIISDPVDDEFIVLMKRNGAVYITTHGIFYAAADIADWSRRLMSFRYNELIPEELIRQGQQPETVAAWEKRWDNLDSLRKKLAILRANTKRVAESGIPVVTGSDTSNSGAGNLLGISSLFELQLLAESGLSPAGIIRAASVNAAAMIGMSDRLGSIEAGHVADMVVLREDPLEDIANVRTIDAVIKSGHVYRPSDFADCALNEPAAGQ